MTSRKNINFRVLVTMDNRWLSVVIAICLAALYFYLQNLFYPHLPIVMDEFQGASSIFQSINDVPYRDFTPYKPVLGYWFQSMFTGTYTDAVSYFEQLKFGIRVVNTLAIASICWLLLGIPQFARKQFVVFAALLMLLVSTFVERSGALRVDMLTVWIGLFSSIAFLKERYISAGLTLGFGFLVSQKIYFFALPWGITLLLYWGVRNQSMSLVKKGILCFLAFLFVIFIYIFVFGMFSSVSDVFSALFLKNSAIAFGDLYQGLSRYWFQSIARNFLFYCILTLALLSLIFNLRELSSLHWKAAVFSFVFTILCLLHKQPWPYFIPFLVSVAVLVIPVWLENTKFNYSLICFLCVALFFQAGVQLQRYSEVKGLSHGYQLEQVALLESQLESGDSYLAGVNLIPTHEQVAGLEWLDASRLATFTESSSYKTLALLKANSPRFILNSYRIQGLPEVIIQWIEREYSPICGNLWERKVDIPLAMEGKPKSHSYGQSDCSVKPLFGDVYGY